MTKRECGTCTKCCEGWLATNILGQEIYPGNPCKFVDINVGCKSYKKRPKDPCKDYQCGWILDLEIPDWMKPNEIHSIVNYGQQEGIHFIRLVEAGDTLHSKALTWFINYGLSKGINLIWEVDGEMSFIGSSEFIEMVQRKNAEFNQRQFPNLALLENE